MNGKRSAATLWESCLRNTLLILLVRLLCMCAEDHQIHINFHVHIWCDVNSFGFLMMPLTHYARARVHDYCAYWLCDHTLSTPTPSIPCISIARLCQNEWALSHLTHTMHQTTWHQATNHQYCRLLSNRIS